MPNTVAQYFFWTQYVIYNFIFIFIAGNTSLFIYKNVKIYPQYLKVIWPRLWLKYMRYLFVNLKIAKCILYGKLCNKIKHFHSYLLQKLLCIILCNYLDELYIVWLKVKLRVTNTTIFYILEESQITILTHVTIQTYVVFQHDILKFKKKDI